MLVPIEPTYVPNGFTVYQHESSKYKLMIIYQNSDGKEIFYSQDLLTQSETIIDTEGAEYELVKIGEQEVHVLQNKGTTQIYWTDLYNTYTIISTLDSGELIKMAESVIKLE